MLTIVVPDKDDLYDEKNNLFITIKGATLQLEHSLLSLSKWESKWLKPFFKKEDKTEEEIIDYIKCMTINSNVNPNVYTILTDQNIKDVIKYINETKTATTFRKEIQTKKSREVITSELIYYYMIVNGIPFECQKWHLDRLMTLIKICSLKNTPNKKVNKREAASRNARINAERRAKYNSKG